MLDNADFNSHAHVERDKMVTFGDEDFVNFNSHAHVERDDEMMKNRLRASISTHTLTWSVT